MSNNWRSNNYNGRGKNYLEGLDSAESIEIKRRKEEQQQKTSHVLTLFSIRRRCKIHQETGEAGDNSFPTVPLYLDSPCIHHGAWQTRVCRQTAASRCHSSFKPTLQQARIWLAKSVIISLPLCARRRPKIEFFPVVIANASRPWCAKPPCNARLRQLLLAPFSPPSFLFNKPDT